MKVGQDKPYFRIFITFIPIVKVVKVIGRHRGNFGQKKKKERNDVKLMQLEVF